MKKKNILIPMMAIALIGGSMSLLNSCGPETEEKQTTVSSIAITTQPTKVSYTEGEKFDKTGMVVTATMDDKTTKVVTDYTIDKTGALTKADTAVTISYKGKTAKVSITVKAKDAVVTSAIAITKQPTKIVYNSGEKFDPTGMEVTATMSDGTKKVVTDYTIDKTGVLASTDTKIVVTYDGKTANVAITVNEVILNSIAITKQPNKVVYNAGEKFKKEGMEVTASYSDGSTKVITGYTIDKTSELTLADTTITVSYGGKTATVSITVNKAALAIIAVTKDPDKLSYLAGETFDPTGMVVSAMYSDTTFKEITGYTYDKTGVLTLDDTIITISYTDDGVTKTTELTIDIKNSISVTLKNGTFADGTSTCLIASDGSGRLPEITTPGKTAVAIQTADKKIHGLSEWGPIAPTTVTVFYAEDEISKGIYTPSDVIKFDGASINTQATKITESGWFKDGTSYTFTAEQVNGGDGAKDYIIIDDGASTFGNESNPISAEGSKSLMSFKNTNTFPITFSFGPEYGGLEPTEVNNITIQPGEIATVNMTSKITIQPWGPGAKPSHYINFSGTYDSEVKIDIIGNFIKEDAYQTTYSVKLKGLTFADSTTEKDVDKNGAMPTVQLETGKTFIAILDADKNIYKNISELPATVSGNMKLTAYYLEDEGATVPYVPCPRYKINDANEGVYGTYSEDGKTMTHPYDVSTLPCKYLITNNQGEYPTSLYDGTQAPFMMKITNMDASASVTMSYGYEYWGYNALVSNQVIAAGTTFTYGWDFDHYADALKAFSYAEITACDSSTTINIKYEGFKLDYSYLL